MLAKRNQQHSGELLSNLGWSCISLKARLPAEEFLSASCRASCPCKHSSHCLAREPYHAVREWFVQEETWMLTSSQLSATFHSPRLLHPHPTWPWTLPDVRYPQLDNLLLALLSDTRHCPLLLRPTLICGWERRCRSSLRYYHPLPWVWAWKWQWFGQCVLKSMILLKNQTASGWRIHWYCRTVF